MLLQTVPAELGFLTDLTYLSVSSRTYVLVTQVKLGFLTDLTYLSVSSRTYVLVTQVKLGFLTDLTYLSVQKLKAAYTSSLRPHTLVA
jgi:hypothetical protein